MWIWTMLTAAALAMPIAELDWRVVNDTVMGGVSQSRVNTTKTVDFAGVLSLERNGGFASVRAPVSAGTFRNARAVKLVLNGDGRAYDFTLYRADVPLRAGSYRVSVQTDQGRTEVVVPLSEFRATSFGRPVPRAPALDTDLDQVVQIGFLLADKQPGPFALEVVSIELLRDDADPGSERSAAREALMSAIDRGAPLFNAGDHAGCADLYDKALRDLLATDAPTAGERSVIRQALSTASRQQAERAAWTLRWAIDSVLIAR